MQAGFRTLEAFGKSITIVYLYGRTDVESVVLFRKACRGPLHGQNVLFNFQGLNFVGSTSLRSFLEGLNDLTKVEGGDVRFCGVSHDFLRVLDATPLRYRPILLDEAGAIASFEAAYVNHAAVAAPVSAVPVSDLSSEGEFLNLNDHGDEDLSLDG